MAEGKDMRRMESPMCPNFSGRKEEYEEWRQRVEDWLIVFGKGEYLGIEVRLGLRGRALEVSKEMGHEELKGKAGARALLDRLDRVYRKDKVNELYGKVRRYLKIERGRGESISDYLIRYERAAEESKRTGGSVLPEIVKGCHLMEQGNLSENQKQMILAACGPEEIKYETVYNLMKRMFENMELKEEGWLEKQTDRDKDKQSQGGFGESKRTNPFGKDGRITKCVICSSIYHWARQCPNNFRNRDKQRKVDDKETKNSEAKERIFWGEEGREEKQWEQIEAVLDTGCSTTLCGEF